MIACYDADGRIYNIYHDPIPDGMEQHLTETGIRWLAVRTSLSVVEISRLMYAVDGQLAPRPACPVVVAIDGLAVALTQIPAGATITLVLDAGDAMESRQDLDHQDGGVSFALDEAGPALVLVSSPWPYQEGRYVLDHQQG